MVYKLSVERELKLSVFQTLMNTYHTWKSSLGTRKRASLSTQTENGKRWINWDSGRQKKNLTKEQRQEKRVGKTLTGIHNLKWKRQQETNTNDPINSCCTSAVLEKSYYYQGVLNKTVVTLDKQGLERNRKSSRLKRTYQRWSGREHRRKQWWTEEKRVLASAPSSQPALLCWAECGSHGRAGGSQGRGRTTRCSTMRGSWKRRRNTKDWSDLKYAQKKVEKKTTVESFHKQIPLADEFTPVCMSIF